MAYDSQTTPVTRDGMAGREGVKGFISVMVGSEDKLNSGAVSWLPFKRTGVYSTLFQDWPA